MEVKRIMKKLRDGVYIVCPRCGKITRLRKGLRLDDWKLTWNMIEETVPIVKNDPLMNERFIDEEIISRDGELETVEHECGFRSEVWGFEDLMIWVKKGQVELGDYWEENIEELKTILEEQEYELRIDVK